ncbi:MAG: DUF3276 family protein [Rectinema sp.]
MGIRGELYSAKFASEGRTYFFNVKQNRVGDVFLSIVESKPTEGESFDRRAIVIFGDQMEGFLDAFRIALKYMDKTGNKVSATTAYDDEGDAVTEKPRSDNDFKPREGGFKPREGGFKPREGGFKPREGGFKPREGGFKPREGGFKPREGGFKPREGGFKPREGGFKPREGGFRRDEDRAASRSYTPGDHKGGQDRHDRFAGKGPRDKTPPRTGKTIVVRRKKKEEGSL